MSLLQYKQAFSVAWESHAAGIQGPAYAKHCGARRESVSETEAGVTKRRRIWLRVPCTGTIGLGTTQVQAPDGDRCHGAGAVGWCRVHGQGLRRRQTNANGKYKSLTTFKLKLPKKAPGPAINRFHHSSFGSAPAVAVSTTFRTP